MKFFLSLLLSSVIFVCSLSQALASDLSVLCADSICTVSSNAPLFGADINWIPEQVVTKTIAVTNAGDYSQELAFVVRPTTTSPLDAYIVLTLEHAGQSVWQGTLAQLFAAEKVDLIALMPHQTSALSMRASMDPATPNEMQRASSVFDFSFTTTLTKEGNDLGESKNSPKNSSHKQESTFEQDSLSESDPGIIAAAANSSPFARPTETLLAEPNQVLPAIHTITQPRGGSVLGSLSACQQQPLWWMVLVLELIALGILQRSRPSRVKRLFQGLTIVGAGLAILALTCSPWFMILVGIPPFLASQVLRTSKKYFRPSTA